MPKDRDDIKNIKAAVLDDLITEYLEKDIFAIQFAKHMMINHSNAKFGSSVDMSEKGKGGWQGQFGLVMAMLVNKPIYRINVHHNASVDTDCYDLLDNFAPELEHHYNHVSDLPTWAQEKLAVLMILETNKVNGEIPGVGRRINEQVFWVYKDGNDTGEEGQGSSQEATG